jgi:hypothetical protein
MGKWTAMLADVTAEKMAAPPPPVPCHNWQKADLTVLAVSGEGDAAEISVTEDSRTAARLDRLIRWGWPRAEAQALAERLAKCDRDVDGRVSCTDCAYYRPGRCGRHRLAGLHSSEIGLDLAGLLQLCPAFSEVAR